MEALLAAGQAGGHILGGVLGADRSSKQPPTNLAALRATAEASFGLLQLLLYLHAFGATFITVVGSSPWQF